MSMQSASYLSIQTVVRMLQIHHDSVLHFCRNSKSLQFISRTISNDINPEIICNMFDLADFVSSSLILNKAKVHKTAITISK